MSRIEDDPNIRAALAWLADASGDARALLGRMESAQQAYRQFTASAENRGQDPVLGEIGADIVAAYLVQAKSLLDDRRSYDLALASKAVPWIKQLGRNVALLDGIAKRRQELGGQLSLRSRT